MRLSLWQTEAGRFGECEASIRNENNTRMAAAYQQAAFDTVRSHTNALFSLDGGCHTRGKILLRL
jgi:hypothetical protein